MNGKKHHQYIGKKGIKQVVYLDRLDTEALFQYPFRHLPHARHLADREGAEEREDGFDRVCDEVLSVCCTRRKRSV